MSDGGGTFPRAGDAPRLRARMRPMPRTIVSKVLTPGLFLLLTACFATSTRVQSPVDFTTELSEATTDAAAHLADASTQVTRDLLEPFKDLLAQMAPGGQARVPRTLKVVVYVLANHQRLQRDIARGGGERLAGFADLAGVPPDHQAEFFRTVQARYRRIYAPTDTAFQSVDRFLSEHYARNWREMLARYAL